MELHQAVKPAVCYPVPCETPDVWDRFKPFVERFIRTWNEFPPGINCPVYFVTCGDPTDEIHDLAETLDAQVNVVPYRGNGMDLGAQQWLAQQLNWAFQINFTSRCYFHREGWLVPLIRDRIATGPGLYGISSSREGSDNGRYVCTRGHSLDSWIFSLYPTVIDTRDLGVHVECGPKSLTRFVESLNLPVRVSTWSTCRELYLSGAVPNTFRLGDQSELLIHDRHTDLYRDADESEKERLRNLMIGAKAESDGLQRCEAP